MDGENWVRLADDRFQWRSFVSTVMNLRIPWRNQAIVEKLSDYQIFREYPVPWSK